MIKLGTYKHYKGKLYRVIGIAAHTETDEKMVVYYPVGNKSQLWVRPASMWEETVNGVPRFMLIQEQVK